MTVMHDCQFAEIRGMPAPPSPGTEVLFPPKTPPFPEGPFPIQGVYESHMYEVLDARLMMEPKLMGKRAYLMQAAAAIPGEIIYCIWNDHGKLLNRYLWRLRGPALAKVELKLVRADKEKKLAPNDDNSVYIFRSMDSREDPEGSCARTHFLQFGADGFLDIIFKFKAKHIRTPMRFSATLVSGGEGSILSVPIWTRTRTVTTYHVWKTTRLVMGRKSATLEIARLRKMSRSKVRYEIMAMDKKLRKENRRSRKVEDELDQRPSKGNVGGKEENSAHGERQEGEALQNVVR